MQQFLDYLSGQGRSANTQTKYLHAVDQWVTYLGAQGWWPMSKAPRNAMRDFVTHLSVGRHMSRAAVKLSVAGVRKWLDWLQGRPEGVGVPDFLAAKVPSQGKRLPLVLTADQLAQYMTLALQVHQPYRTALLTLPFCGLRINEFVTLRLGNIDTSRLGRDGRPRLVLRIIGKGDKERMVPVFSGINRALFAYLTGWRREFATKNPVDRRTSEAQRWLFPAPVLHAYNHISRQSMEAMVAQMRPRLRLDHLRPHSMRATYLTALLNTGVPMHEAARYAGHANIQTLFDHYAGLHIEGAGEIFGDIARLG